MWLPYAFYLALSIVCVFANEHEQHPVVRTPNGRIRGSLGTSRLRNTFNSFRGIRYAKPPVGDLRFKPPVPYGRWNGVYDATQDMPFCPQSSYNNTSEDCLMLNVYTTELPENGKNPKRPVLVFIHDGGFYSFSGNSFLRGPEYFVDQDIVLVSINYRLAILGFLSTGDELAPGNNGMKDQVLALKWIQENIESFGGDKNSVTLLGYSAGGRSIILHMVSPMARGLFHRGICMSGAHIGVLPIPYDQLNLAKKIAAYLGCPTNSSRNIIDCLKTKSTNELGNSLPALREIDFNPVITFTPVIEKDFGQSRYLTDHPVKLIVEGNFYKVPVIVGRNKDEYVYKAYQIIANETARKMVEENFEKWAPVIFCYERDTERSKRVSQGVREFYLGGQPISNATVDEFGEVFADTIVGFAAERVIKLLATYSDKPLYYYKTTFLGSVSSFYLPGSNDTIPYGVVHQDELIYMFYRAYRPFFNESYPTESRTVSKLTTLWANFARTGNPTPDRIELFNNIRWEQYNLKSQKYLDFGKQLLMKERMFADRYAFWERYYPISSYP